VGKQIVAEVNRVEVGILVAMRGQPTMRRPVFAILLLRPILGRDESRFQRYDMIVSGRDQGRPQHDVEVLRLAAVSKPFRASRTMQLVGAKVLGAIKGDQHMAIGLAEHVQAARCRQLRQHRVERRMQRRGFGGIQHGADVIVARDLGQPEQGFAIRPAAALTQPLLMRQEGRTLHEKHRERRDADIGDRIGQVRPMTLVRERLTASTQAGDQGAQAVHQAVESDFRPFRKSHFAAGRGFPMRCGFGDSPALGLAPG
jgi:hypothetical protein